MHRELEKRKFSSLNKETCRNIFVVRKNVVIGFSLELWSPNSFRNWRACSTLIDKPAHSTTGLFQRERNRDGCQKEEEQRGRRRRCHQPNYQRIYFVTSCLSSRQKRPALTSVLSKRWRDLFTLIPSLDLDDSIFVLGERPEECERTSFMEFASRVLALQSNSPITKFSIRCHKGVDDNLVEDWVVKALRRGATDLSLVLLFPSRMYSRPSSTIFFNGKRNLIKLKLGCGRLGRFRHSLLRRDLIFTKLKTLHLDSIDFGRHYDAGFARLLSKMPCA